MEPTLSVIVPVRDEEENLAPLHAELSAALGGLGAEYEIVYVDDGSRDGSFGVLEELQGHDPHTTVIRLARGYGQTAALAAGIDCTSGEIIVSLDGDGQNDPADIPALLAKLEQGHDLVAGWRRPRRDGLVTRVWPSMIANYVIGWTTGARLHDHGCGLKVFRRQALDGLKLFGEMHRFIPALASELGARVTELPVNHRPRRRGASKYGLGRTRRVLLDLVAVRFLWGRDSSPIQLFGTIGLVIGGAGIALTGFLGAQRIFFDVALAERPLVWLAILLTLIGLQMLAMGLLGELVVRTHREILGGQGYRVAETRGKSRARHTPNH